MSELFCKAQPIGSQEIPDCYISIDQGLPEYESPRDARRFFECEGAALAEVLHTHLPGGTFDQVLLAMSKIKVSLLTVSYGELSKMGIGEEER